METPSRGIPLKKKKFLLRDSDRDGFTRRNVELFLDNGSLVGGDEFDSPPPSNRLYPGEGDVSPGDTRSNYKDYGNQPATQPQVQNITGSTQITLNQQVDNAKNYDYNKSILYVQGSNPEQLTNASFETWTGLTDLLTNGNMETGSPPSSWSLVGAGAAWARESTIIKEGSYSGKISTAAVTATVQNTYDAGVGARNNTYIFGAWVWCASASTAYIQIIDTDGVAPSAYHSGSSSWEYLSIARTCSGTVTACIFQCVCAGASKIAYFDSVKCYVQLAPTGWTLTGAGATVSREEGTVKVGTYSAKLTRNGTNTFLVNSDYNTGTIWGKTLAYWQGRTITCGD